VPNRLHASAYWATSRRVLAAADQDRRARRLQRLRDADRLGQVVVLAVVGGVVAPHLLADLEGLLEALEPLGHRRVGNAEGQVLALVPGGANAICIARS
jgi:hypothetical protein